MENLSLLNSGESCIIENISSKGDICRRFLDIGLIKGTQVKCVAKSPSGDPKAYLIRGAVIAIRRDDCKDIKIRRL